MAKDDHTHEVPKEKPGFYQRLVTAGHIDDSRLSKRGRRILEWLSGCDDDTTAGLEELLRLVREGAACPHGFSNPTWCAICIPSEGARDVSRR